MRDVEDAIVYEGADAARMRLREWFDKRILKSMEAEGTLAIGLFQTSQGAGDDPVETFEYGFDEPVEGLITEIVDSACNDAEEQGRGRRVKYTVRVEGINARCTFSIAIPYEEDEDIDDIDEPANKRGLISQQMRHNEKLMRITVGSFDKMYDMALRLIRDKDERVKFLERHQVESIKQFEELNSARHARDIENRKMDNEERRKDKVAGILLQGMPVLMSKLMGGGKAAAVAGPDGGPPRTPLENMLEGMLGSMGREQFQKLVESGVFSPDQIATLMEMAQYIMDRHEAEEEARKKSQQGHSPSADSSSQQDKKEANTPKEGTFE